MLVVRVELHSAITGKVTEIARMIIGNVGGSKNLGDYVCRTYRGRSAEDLDKRAVQRSGKVETYPRLSLHVWHLVGRCLVSMGYVGKKELPQPSDM